MAQVTAITGSQSTAGDLPFDLAWRGSEGPEIRLGNRDVELARLAVARTVQQRPALVFLSERGLRRFDVCCPIGADEPVVATVRIRHRESGRVVAEKRIEISFHERNGEHVPTVAFARRGRRSRESRPSADRPMPRQGAAMTAEQQYLLDVLCCSACGAPYEIGDTEVVCSRCGSRHPVVDGIPVLLEPTTIGTILDRSGYEGISGVNDERVLGVIGSQWKAIIDRLGFEPKSALEIGAGTGALSLGLLREEAVGRLTVTDVSVTFLRMLLPRVAAYSTPTSLIACDANEANFRANAFDLVLGRSCLHHMLDYDSTLRHCHAVLEPGGAAVFYEPVLDGKIFLTLFMGLMLHIDEMSDAPQLTPIDQKTIRATMGHHMKSKLYPQDRASLSRLEDKYVFEIDQLRRVGVDVGFSEVEFLNDGKVETGYWRNLVYTLQVMGVAPEKIEDHRWICDVFADTYGLMLPDRLVTPMGYFVFRK